jgi:hypothetical protein
VTNSSKNSVPADPGAAPVRDEWGLYDPQQAGLAAVFRRLTKLEDRISTTTPPRSPAAE